MKRCLRSDLFWANLFQFETVTDRRKWVVSVQYIQTALRTPPRPTMVSRTTTINNLIQENIPAMHSTSARVRIRAVASGQDAQLQSQWCCHSTPSSPFSTQHCTNHVLDSYTVMIHVFRASWAPCEGRYMPVPGPDGLVPLYTTTCSSAPQPHSRIQPR